MALLFSAAAWTALGAQNGCGQGSSAASTSSQGSATLEACAAGQSLAGAAYDIAKSRFAFGSTPDPVDAGSLVRWTGTDGVVAIFADGSEMASMNAGAPQANLPGFSPDGTTLASYVTDYFESMGVEPCQIAGTDETFGGGGGGSTSADGGDTLLVASQATAGLERAIDGVRVVESRAFAQFDADDQTTYEAFYWPEIQADVVQKALAFEAQLAAPGGLAAYKAKLPADAQGDGAVVIHHHVAGASAAFAAVAVYDTVQITPEDDGGDLYFDSDGNAVTDTWSGL